MSIFKIKKIISFFFLIIFLTSFILPFSVFAEESALSISADWDSSLINKSVLITATHTLGLSSLNPLAKVNFSSSPVWGGGFSETSCSPKAINTSVETCSVSFTPSKKGIYKINASFSDSISNTISIEAADAFLTATSEASVVIGKPTPIKVTTSDKTGEGKTVVFSFPQTALEQEGASLDKYACTLDENGSCSVNFSSTKAHLFGTVIYYKASGYVSGEIRIRVNGTDITAEEEKPKTEENYYPLANLPGLGETCTPSCDAENNCKTTCVKIAPNCDKNGKNCTPPMGFAGYLNIMIKIFIGICAILAMIMIVMGGIQYMTSGLVSSKQAAKETITNAILGLLLALGAFAILNTINPDLVNINLSKVQQATVTVLTREEIVLNNLKNNKVFKRGPYYEIIKTLVANRYPHCIMQANSQIESNGSTSKVIGHDENVTSFKTISRNPFINSGIKFSGTTFTKGSNVQNDDGSNQGTSLNPNDINLSLDTRFSHSVGMFGATFFGNNTIEECNKPGKHTVSCFHITDGSNTKIKDIYNNTNNADIKWATDFAFKGWNSCGKDPIRVFYYFANNCSTPTKGSAKEVIANQKLDLYNQCLKQDK